MKRSVRFLALCWALLGVGGVVVGIEHADERPECVERAMKETAHPERRPDMDVVSAPAVLIVEQPCPAARVVPQVYRPGAGLRFADRGLPHLC
ncbi:MAG: hypothetical protein KDA32_06770 [Phycisphaerales bacterium]|nr:hypothetical protein [Phycisphaerales bacterium]